MDQAIFTTLETLGPLLAKVAEVHGRQDPRLVTAALELPEIRARLEQEPTDLAGALAALERLSGLTDGFAPPEHACRSYRRALSDLEWLRWRLTPSTTPHHPAARRPGATR